MPIGTARMAALCLPNSRTFVGVRFDGDADVRRELSDPSRPAALLYPGVGARDVFVDPPRGPTTLVVVDGTWAQARSVVRRNPFLLALPRWAFAPPEPSRYGDVRREPRDDYVSTIEAIAHVLSAVEGDAARFQPMFTAMDAMLDAHLAAQARAPIERVYRPRDLGRPAIHVRQGRKKDAATLAAILRRCFDAAMPWLPNLHTPDEDVRFLRDRVLRSEEVAVAEMDGRVAGFAALGRRDGEDFLEHLYVAPEMHGRGVGTVLFDRAKKRRPAGFRWWVFQRNEAARRFYEKRGARLVLLTDGAGNEEKTPDALYEWRP